MMGYFNNLSIAEEHLPLHSKQKQGKEIVQG